MANSMYFLVKLLYMKLYKKLENGNKIKCINNIQISNVGRYLS